MEIKPVESITIKDVAPKPEDRARNSSTTLKKTVLEDHGYTIGKQIGSGSYAKVKIAYSIDYQCVVAVKIISKFRASNDYLKRFLPREIEVVKGLRHENLIRFYQSIETTHRVYIIMQYAENGSLLDKIRAERYLDERLARKYFIQLINVIDYCHGRGVVHRDIKCENILLDKNDNVKLIDFGFGRANMKSENGQFLYSKTYCGSYAYASPEILKAIPYQPNASDVWATGVVLYAMVFGHLPFDDSCFSQLIKQVEMKMVFPREPDVSQSCKGLIRRVLAPLKLRLTIDHIRKDIWFMMSSLPSTTRRSSGDKSELAEATGGGSHHSNSGGK